ncbi:MAG: DUF1343 domain-containing protein [Deltaproteobacteria bacterium]|jgi:uncharacterized protein YbbC (DUF1343 family)|nr:DUF1343 domain-containing protein [Deltaproteobacteria bacterium]
MMMFAAPRVQTGLSVFLRSHCDGYRGKSLGLLCNQASVGPDLRHALELADSAMPGTIKAVFSPQHGLYGAMQDNMEESPHSRLPDGRPVWSLYGEGRVPEPRMLEGLDAVVCDLQDVGVRVYTFAQTLFGVMDACAAQDIEVVVLDRPNPSGGLVMEGAILSPEFMSFVGMTPVPLMHGFTLAEHAVFRNAASEAPCRLTVVPMIGWERGMDFSATGLPWVMPSPNLPTPDSASVYPGSVIFEGTNLSEGRGTSRPFQLIGAPYADRDALAARLDAMKVPGTFFRPVEFKPMFGKWAGEICRGVEIHPVDPMFKPFRSALSLLEAVLRLWPDDFALKDPPYEYEFARRPIDLIMGCEDLFNDLAAGVSAEEICFNLEPPVRAFDRRRTDSLLYRQ